MKYNSELALDLGTTLGWATPEASGSVKLQAKNREPKGMRFLRFAQWLEETYKVNGGLRRVYFEEVVGHKGKAASHMYGGYWAILLAFCEMKGVLAEGVPVKTIKKYATGNGNADKEMMMDAYRARWGCDPVDNNEADAKWLLAYIHSQR